MKYRRNIPYLGDEEANACADVIKSGMVVRGKVVKEFEKKFAEYNNKKYCVMTSNCTTALQLSLEIAQRKVFLETGVMPKKVHIPDFTFMATGNSVLNVGMDPVIHDINLSTYNVEFDKELIRKSDILMPMHCFGNACKPKEWWDDHFIIEDCATAIGSDNIGYGAIQCFSFHGAKVMTTGIGGALTTNHKDVAELAEELARAGRPHWRQKSYNYQISNINAAIGIEQLKKLPYIIKHRRKFGKRYDEIFNGHCIKHQHTDGTNYQSYVIRVDEDIRDHLIEFLRSREIEACKGNYSLSNLYFNGFAPMGNQLDKEQICLPLYVQMTKDDQDTIIENVVDGIEEMT